MSDACDNPRCRDGFVQHFAAQPGYEWTPCRGCNPNGEPRMTFSAPSLAEQIAREVGAAASVKRRPEQER